jgi:glycine cleavage system H protein
MSIPADLRYSPDHEWVRRQGDRVRIGLTHYAQESLGDVVYVEVPAIGTAVVANASFSEVESTKSVSDVFAPVSGTVVAVNDELADSPQSVNIDPYGAGWLCDIEMSNPSEYDSLLDATAYGELVGG